MRVCYLLACIMMLSTSSSAQKVASKYSKDQVVIDQGQRLFELKCAACHNFRQQGIGPSLAGVTATRNFDWLIKFIQNPKELIENGDRQAVSLFNRYKTAMPANQDLGQPEMQALLSYINKFRIIKIEKGVQGPENSAFASPVKDPLPLKIQKSKLSLYLEDVATAPVSDTKVPFARINDMVVLKGKRDRLFIQEMRGRLYELRDTSFITVFDLAKERPEFVSAPGLGSGFGSYAFHPDFYDNGLFYTTHTEKPANNPSDFVYDPSIRVAIQWVVTEWKFDDPGTEIFSGSSRELLRINMPYEMHGMQQICFDPFAKRGSPDYGLLYIALGDGGSTEHGYPQLCNSDSAMRGAILRIDPSGRNSANKKYGIPVVNPFAKMATTKIPGELFARGFRNPNRISWAPDGKMLIADIGQTNIEEINVGVAGGNYGWPSREGTFAMNYRDKMNLVYALPTGSYKYLSPVLQYDHDEGNAISAGFVYTGSIAALKNKYVFADIVNGRVFVADYPTFRQGHQSEIGEFNLYFNGKPGTFVQITGSAKADLRLGVGIGNELYLYSKVDGRIWRVSDCRGE
ncbi:MAG: PQQ-dependent sugar dehydrogenase [Flavitalea sp.]